jgi:hypothetical protein
MSISYLFYLSLHYKFNITQYILFHNHWVSVRAYFEVGWAVIGGGRNTNSNHKSQQRRLLLECKRLHSQGISQKRETKTQKRSEVKTGGGRGAAAQRGLVVRSAAVRWVSTHGWVGL